ncbi:hypothetical protein LAZ67_4000686 [Cordylochernes scorpioides]|uniref:Uncharacterized protein n=1 Tax=Cordylochernes scorpioides TaxID=51811 RepID=A0ABY6KBG5_9ARAC|nr:hypothetical protein LAZ67_4000686 [Cordylochernes scorpioides]
MDKLKRERTPLRNTITRTTNEIKSGLSLEEVDIILIRAKFERLTILSDRLILIDDKIKEILLDDPRSTEAQINDEMEQCETYSLQVGIVAQKVKEYESKLAASCDDKMSQSSTSDVKRQIKLPKFELKKYTGELEEWLSWWSHFEKIHLDESLSDVDKFESILIKCKFHKRTSLKTFVTMHQFRPNFQHLCKTRWSRFCLTSKYFSLTLTCVTSLLSIKYKKNQQS